MTHLEFEDWWHYKRVKPTGFYQIPDKEYIVTACILNDGGEYGSKFAIMATDYSLENKQWFTFDLTKEETEKLAERFEILGDYNNIGFEILFEFLGFDENGDLITAFKNFTGNFEDKTIYPKFKTQNVVVGDKLFDIGWYSTTGEKLRKSFLLRKDDWGQFSNQEIYDKFQHVRYWVRGGLYHFGINPFDLKEVR